MNTKSITVWATSNANINPGTKGYTVHVTDPDPGVENDRRTYASGFGVPITMEIPALWEVAEGGDGMMHLFSSSTTPLYLAWNLDNGQVNSWPLFATRKEAIKHGAILNHKASHAN